MQHVTCCGKGTKIIPRGSKREDRYIVQLNYNYCIASILPRYKVLLWQFQELNNFTHVNHGGSRGLCNHPRGNAGQTGQALW